MTTTLPAPATKVERIDVQRAMLLILAESKTRPYPIGINQNGPGSDILVVHWATLAGLYQWTDFFGFTAESVRRRLSDDGSKIRATGYAWGWHGWSIQAEADEPVTTTDAETAALIDEVTAEPEEPASVADHVGDIWERGADGLYRFSPGDGIDANRGMTYGELFEAFGPLAAVGPDRADMESAWHDGLDEASAAIFASQQDERDDALMRAATAEHACKTCGGDVVHRAGCPQEPEHLADHYAADPPMLCTRCGDPLLPGQLIEQRTAGRVHVGCELGPQCIDCGVLGGGHQESCAFASRVNPEAAEKLPVLVLDVTPNPAPSADIDDTIAALTANLDLPIPYTPVPHPTGKQANAAECARLRGETGHRPPTGLPLLVNGHVPSTPTDHGPVPIVEVTSVEPGPLDARDDNAVMAGVLPQQTSFAQAAERLETVRDAEVAEYAHAMLAEASE